MVLPEFEKNFSNIDKDIKDIIGDFLVDNNDQVKQHDYLKIYNFVFHYGNVYENAEYLYKYFIQIIKENTKELAKKLKDKPNSEIIELFIDISCKMNKIIFFMVHTFSYVDFYFIISRNLKKLTECALEIYRNYLFLPVQNQLIEEVNKLLKEDRLGKKEHRDKIKQILNIMKTMDLSNPKIFKKNNVCIWESRNKEEEKSLDIQNNWFNLFMKDFEEFLDSKVKEDIQKNSIPEYVSIQLEFLKEEKQRQEELFINEIFLPRLNEFIYKKIIGENMKEIIEKDTGFKSMLENQKYEEITNLYELIKFYEPSLKELAKVFHEYVQKRGKLLKEKEEIKTNQELFVQQLTELQNEINSVVEKCFKNNEILLSAAKQAFNELMNTNDNKKEIAK